MNEPRPHRPLPISVIAGGTGSTAVVARSGSLCPGAPGQVREPSGPFCYFISYVHSVSCRAGTGRHPESYTDCPEDSFGLPRSFLLEELERSAYSKGMKTQGRVNTIMMRPHHSSPRRVDVKSKQHAVDCRPTIA